MRFVAWRGLSPEYRAAVDGHSPWRPGQRDPDPIFVPDILATSEPAWLKERLAKEGIRGLAFMPLVDQGEVIGKFMTYHTEPHTFSAHEIETAVTIARQLGFSLERSRAEAELKISEQRFRVMSEDAPVMIWVSDVDGSCLHLNRMLRSFWGVREADVGSFDWSTTMHPDDASSIVAAMAEALRGATPVQVQGRYRRADGEYRVLQTEARPTFSAKGAFRGMIGVNVDVTDRVRAADALQERERRFRELANTMPQLVWSSDASGQVTYWNPKSSATRPSIRRRTGPFIGAVYCTMKTSNRP